MNAHGPVYVAISSIGYKWLHFHACRPVTDAEMGKNVSWKYPRNHTVAEGIEDENIIDVVGDIIRRHFDGSEVKFEDQIIPYYHTHKAYHTCWGDYRKSFQEIRYDVRSRYKADFFTSIVSPLEEVKYRNCFAGTIKTLESFQAQERRRDERESKMILRQIESIKRGREQQRKRAEQRMECARNRPIKSTPNILKMIGAANQLTEITQ